MFYAILSGNNRTNLLWRKQNMKFTFAHNNLNVYDLEKSLDFYKEALGLEVVRTKDASDGSFKLVYLGDGTTPHQL